MNLPEIFMVLDQNLKGVKHVRAVATSAMREASNSKLLVEAVMKHTGISVEVIDGLEEGRLIFSAVSNRVDLDGSRSILIDVGGGSVEITVAEGLKIKATQSFPLGTVRMLEALETRGLKEKHLPTVIEEHFRPVRNFLRDQLKDKPVDLSQRGAAILFKNVPVEAQAAIAEVSRKVDAEFNQTSRTNLGETKLQVRKRY